MDDAETDQFPSPPKPRWAVLIIWVVLRAALETVTQFGPDLITQITAHVIASIGDVTVVVWQWANRVEAT